MKSENGLGSSEEVLRERRRNSIGGGWVASEVSGTVNNERS